MKVTIFKSTFRKSGANCIRKLQSVFKRTKDRGEVQLLFGVEREGLCKTNEVVDPYFVQFIYIKIFTYTSVLIKVLDKEIGPPTWTRIL